MKYKVMCQNFVVSWVVGLHMMQPAQWAQVTNGHATPGLCNVCHSCISKVVGHRFYCSISGIYLHDQVFSVYGYHKIQTEKIFTMMKVKFCFVKWQLTKYIMDWLICQSQLVLCPRSAFICTKVS